MIAQRTDKGTFVPTHRMSKTILYHKWISMKSRCYNPKNKKYPRYGGRGLRVCPEWEKSFENFYKWAMENGYRDDLTIDRIDNDKGYSPGNCRFATYKEQNRNRSSLNLITYKGKTQCVAAWAEETGWSETSIRRRTKKGLPLEREVSPE